MTPTRISFGELWEPLNQCNSPTHSRLIEGMHLPKIENSEVGQLIDALRSNNAESAALRLMSCGVAAVRPLRDFLILGRPSNVFQPRYLAVEALAGLQAKELLAEFLRYDKEIEDPAVRLGEEAVKEKAARELASWKTEDVFNLLLDLIRRRPLAGFIEAIATFKRPEPIPYLIDALGDDLCLPAAEEALKKVYLSAGPFLISATLKPYPQNNNESPSSIRRRRSACRLLAGKGISDEEWPALASLLDGEDLVLLTVIAGIGVNVGSAKEKKKIANLLLDALPGIDWSLQDDIENILASCFEECETRIEAEIKSRSPLAGAKPTWDPFLLALMRIKRKAEVLKR